MFGLSVADFLEEGADSISGIKIGRDSNRDGRNSAGKSASDTAAVYQGSDLFQIIAGAAAKNSNLAAQAAAGRRNSG